MTRLRLLSGTAVALAMIGTVAAAHEVSKGRLFFTDEEAPVLRVLDLDEGRVTHELPLVSTPNPAYVAGEKDASSLPIGFRLLDAGGAVLAELDRPDDPARRCRGYHGHAAKGELHLFGCFMRQEGHPLSDGGVLVVRDTPAGVETRKLDYPDDRRTSTLSWGGGRWAVGNYGRPGEYRAFLRIDPDAAALSPADVMPVAGGQIVCQFVVTGDRLVNLTPDGTLRLYEVASWRAGRWWRRSTAPGTRRCGPSSCGWASGSM